MGNPFYMAMTGAEFSACEQLPAHVAWMACHFSPYGTALSNLPQTLPPEAILMVNDRIPPYGHDPERIVAQLQELSFQFQIDGILLDFQRPNDPLTRQIVETILTALPHTVAVSHHYANDFPCPIFLPPPPIRCDPAEYFRPYCGREVWMEVYDQWEAAKITSSGCEISDIAAQKASLPYRDDTLRCQYGVETAEAQATITLHRSVEDLLEISPLVSSFVGLWQELGSTVK